MLRHALDADHYTSPQTFALEQQNLFGKHWIFAGFAQFLREQNRFVARQIAGVPILLQRTARGIEAFINECPHRLAAVQVEPFGKRPMICPYHGWSFGEGGHLKGLPNEGLYNFSPEEKKKACLRKLHVAEVGNLLFVSFADDAPPLDGQFDPAFIDEVRAASESLDTQIIYSRFRVRYNWKLNIENVKDYNHVPFVHPRTFYPEMSAPVTSLEARPPVVPALLESRETARLPELSYATRAPIEPREMWFKDLIDAFGTEHVYYNWFLYPNVNFCSIRGQHFLLQQYDPVSPGETDYHLWMMTARRHDTRTDFTALLRAIMNSERFVIQEDAIHLEALQQGFNPRSSRVMHGDYEEPLVKQHLWYRANVLQEVRHHG